MENLYSGIIQAAGDLRQVLPAHLHKKRIDLHHVDMLDLLILYKLPDNAAVSSSDYQNVLYKRMDCHWNMGDHFMINKFILFCQSQISVHNKDFAELLRVQHINLLKFTLSAEKLFSHPDRKLHILCVFVRKPHFHGTTLPSLH